MNPNKYVKFPLNFQTGLGYSPNSGPPQGGWENTPGTQFYQMPLYSILPNGSTPTSNQHFFGRPRPPKIKPRYFGYPLMNQPSSTLDMQMFPAYPVGPGDTSGGDGGQFLQGLPSFQQYWGFGKRRRSRKRKSRRSHKRKSRRSRRSRRFGKQSKIRNLINRIKRHIKHPGRPNLAKQMYVL